jgi:hypothetical protein
MLARKFDMRLADMKAQLAEQMAEVSRHRNRLELLAQQSSKREATLADRETESRGMREQLEPLENELAERTQTIQLLEQEAHAKDELIARLNQEIAGLKHVIAERDQALASPEAGTRVLPAPAVIAPEMLTAQERLALRIEDLTRLSHEIAGQREQFAAERDKFSALRQAIALPAPPPIEGDLGLREPSVQLDALDEHGRAIEEKLAEAERESEALAEELRSLDEAWSKKVDELDQGPEPKAAANENGETVVTSYATGAQEPQPSETRQRASGNVVSLAQRIKALQRDISR